MNSPGEQIPPGTDDPSIGAGLGESGLSGNVENQEVARIVHPSEAGPEVVPSGNFPQGVEGDLPPPSSKPTRAGRAGGGTEVISMLADRRAARRHHPRNRKAMGPAKLLGLFAAAQLLLILLVVVFFGSGIRAWLGGSAQAPDGVSAEDAAALRDEMHRAGSEFERIESDLDVMKKRIAINPGDAWEQLEQLGARNRLTVFADDAITNGSRAAYDELVAASEDTGSDRRLRDGASAEIFRVKHFYGSGTRLGGYSLPVASLYPSQKTKTEQELGTSELIRLLGDQEQTWQVRSRAAYLLGSHRKLVVAEALVRAAKEDPNLDVVKECVFTFEENTGYRADGLFEIESLVNWWTVYEARVGAAAVEREDPSS